MNKNYETQIKSDDFCLNTTTDGCIYGKMSSFVEVNKIAKRQGNVEYLGNYMVWENDNVYAVFHTEETNYFVQLRY